MRASDVKKIRFAAPIPFRANNDGTPREEQGVKLGQTYAGDVIRVMHQGSYRNLGDTQRKIAAYLAAHGIERNGDIWEAYVNDPASVPESELLTEIYYPVR
jgi:effector-binding domain-containing protein